MYFSPYNAVKNQILRRNTKEEQRKPVFGFNKSQGYNSLGPLLPAFGTEIQEAFLKCTENLEKRPFLVRLLSNCLVKEIKFLDDFSPYCTRYKEANDNDVF